MRRLAETSFVRQTLPEQVAAQIRKAILDGRLEPGEPLRQEELATQFATSRIPVREALRQLEAEGLVAYPPNRGAVVASLSADDVLEIFDLRALLEPEALRLAIPHHTKKLWAEASALLDHMESDPSSHPWDESNWEWHRLLYSTAARPRLLSMIENLRVHGDRYVHGGALLAKEKYKAHAGREHRDVLRACKQQDIDKACLALTKHIRSSLDTLRANLLEK